MSRRKREAVAARSVAAAKGKQPGTKAGWKKFTSPRQIGIAAVVLLLGLGVAGAVSEKYKHSFLSGNESLSNAPASQPQQPIQTGTPQLSKEYIYAGGRMLAVEDTNAQLAGPNSISGSIIYGTPQENQPVRFVSGMWMSINGQDWQANGTYNFSNLIPGATYIIEPKKPRYSQVSTSTFSPFDAVLVLREIAAGPGILTPNQRIAADASGDGNISPFDATLILRYIAANGATDEGNIGHWRFSPGSQTYSPFLSTLTGENYDAMVVGDTYGTWVPTGETSAATAGPITYNIQIYPPSDATAAKGDTILIPIYFSNTGNQAVGSYSFQFTFNPWVLEPNAAPINALGTLSAGCQIIKNTSSVGIIGVTAYCSTPISAGSGTLLYLRLNVKDDDSMPGETLLSFKYSNDGTNPLFENSQGNRIGSMPASGYFTVEALELEEAAASDSLLNRKIEDSSATVAGKAEAFVQPTQQQQQAQRQPGTEEMEISLPQNAAATPGSALSIPVTLTNGAGGKLSGFSFDVQFNPALVQPADAAIETTGTLSSKCEVVARTVTPGRVKIVGACNDDITAQAGTLVKLRFTATGQANNASHEARALKLRQIPVFENNKGHRIRVGRTNGNIR
jgi:hypothetical protein